MVFIFRFGQAGGFTKIRERFEIIMGFKKTELMSSVNSEEKVINEIVEKESEDQKVDVTDSMISSTDNMEVLSLFISFICKNCLNYKS